jgi:hypothetical protein
MSADRKSTVKQVPPYIFHSAFSQLICQICCWLVQFLTQMAYETRTAAGVVMCSTTQAALGMSQPINQTVIKLRTPNLFKHAQSDAHYWLAVIAHCSHGTQGRLTHCIGTKM